MEKESRKSAKRMTEPELYLRLSRELDKYKNNRSYFYEKNIVRKALMLRHFGWHGGLEPPEDWSDEETVEIVLPFKKGQILHCEVCGMEDDEHHNDKSCTLTKLKGMKMVALENDYLDIAKKIERFIGELA